MAPASAKAGQAVAPRSPGLSAPTFATSCSRAVTAAATAAEACHVSCRCALRSSGMRWSCLRQPPVRWSETGPSAWEPTSASPAPGDPAPRPRRGSPVGRLTPGFTAALKPPASRKRHFTSSEASAAPAASATMPFPALLRLHAAGTPSTTSTDSDTPRESVAAAVPPTSRAPGSGWSRRTSAVSSSWTARAPWVPVSSVTSGWAARVGTGSRPRAAKMLRSVLNMRGRLNEPEKQCQHARRGTMGGEEREARACHNASPDEACRREHRPRRLDPPPPLRLARLTARPGAQGGASAARRAPPRRAARGRRRHHAPLDGAHARARAGRRAVPRRRPAARRVPALLLAHELPPGARRALRAAAAATGGARPRERPRPHGVRRARRRRRRGDRRRSLGEGPRRRAQALRRGGRAARDARVEPDARPAARRARGGQEARRRADGPRPQRALPRPRGPHDRRAPRRPARGGARPPLTRRLARRRRARAARHLARPPEGPRPARGPGLRDPGPMPLPWRVPRAGEGDRLVPRRAAGRAPPARRAARAGGGAAARGREDELPGRRAEGRDLGGAARRARLSDRLGAAVVEGAAALHGLRPRRADGARAPGEARHRREPRGDGVALGPESRVRMVASAGRPVPAPAGSPLSPPGEGAPEGAAK